jgi:hypothetical protein
MVRRWHTSIVCGSVLGVCILLASGGAHADHTEKDRQTDFSAFTLRGRQARVGLFKLEYGIFDRWMVGTYTLPWVLMPIVKGPILNLNTKVALLSFERFQLSGKLSVFYADIDDIQTSSVEDGAFDGTIVPMTAQASWLVGQDWTVSGELTWVQTVLHGDVESTSDASAGGVAGQSNFQIAATAEYRLGPHVAVNLVSRFAPYIQPLAITSEGEINGDTSVEIQAEIESDNQFGFLVQPGLTFSWGIWNLRAGLGVGNIFIPGPALVTGIRTLVPDFDFYARF